MKLKLIKLKLINILINNRLIKVPITFTVLQACEQRVCAEEIPRFFTPRKCLLGNSQNKFFKIKNLKGFINNRLNKNIIQEIKLAGLFLFVGCAASHIMVPTIVVMSGMAHDSLIFYNICKKIKEESINTPDLIANATEALLRKQFDWQNPLIVNKWEALKEMLMNELLFLQDNLINFINKKIGLSRQEYDSPFTVADSFKKYQAYEACINSMRHWHIHCYSEEALDIIVRLMREREPPNTGPTGYELHDFFEYRSKDVVQQFIEEQTAININSNLSVRKGLEENKNLNFSDVNKSHKEFLFCAATVVAIGLIVNKCY